MDDKSKYPDLLTLRERQALRLKRWLEDAKGCPLTKTGHQTAAKIFACPWLEEGIAELVKAGLFDVGRGCIARRDEDLFG